MLPDVEKGNNVM